MQQPIFNLTVLFNISKSYIKLTTSYIARKVLYMSSIVTNHATYYATYMFLHVYIINLYGRYILHYIYYHHLI